MMDSNCVSDIVPPQKNVISHINFNWRRLAVLSQVMRAEVSRLCRTENSLLVSNPAHTSLFTFMVEHMWGNSHHLHFKLWSKASDEGFASKWHQLQLIVPVLSEPNKVSDWKLSAIYRLSPQTDSIPDIKESLVGGGGGQRGLGKCILRPGHCEMLQCTVCS